MMANAMKAFEKALSDEERTFLQEMKSPALVQSYLDNVRYPSGERNRSPIEVLRQREAHCLDGGLFAASALRRIGYAPLIVDMQPDPGQDDDHVLALFQEFGCWGAVAKSNFSGLRFREPVYTSVRELVLSYFEVFFNLEKQKTLRFYTAPIDMEQFDHLHWMTESAGVDAMEVYLKTAELIPLFSPEQTRYFSEVDERSFRAGTLGINPEGMFKP
jgi:hypothetical protein